MADQQPNERTIFLEAIEIASVEERCEFVARACGDDFSLRAEVEALIDEHQREQPLLDACRNAANAAPSAGHSSDMQIGPYKLLEEIGEGGMGIVYKAEQSQPVRRTVALKIIKPGMYTKEVITRFEAERQTLAIMDHPNIAHVLDAGTTDQGRPYFVMELAQGVTLTEYCDQNQLAGQQRLALFATVCRAVHHAHQKGIIHRDLKPSNILVTNRDGRPTPKIIDFGIAKATHRQITDETIFTSSGQLIGTPLYMSPEQGDGSGLDLDTRTDIYSLGVVLYELLTGTTPFESQLLRDVGLDEYRRQVREEEPLRPSVKVRTANGAAAVASANHKIDSHKLSRVLRQELDWIVMKALEKDRMRRYDTANDFAKDVERYLKHEPIEACPPSTVYRLRKFAQRNGKTVFGAMAVALALVVSAAAATGQAIRATNAEGRAREQIRLADQQRRLAQEQERLANQQRVLADEAAQSEKDLRKMAEDNARRAETEGKQAEANLHLAFEALDQVYLSVSEQLLPEKSRIDDTDYDLLTKALDFYERFAKQNPADTQFSLKTVEAYQQVACLFEELGETEQAKSAFTKTIELLERLEPEGELSADHRSRLAASLSGLGSVLRAVGDFGEAEEVLTKCLKIRDELSVEDPNRPDRRRSVADVYNQLSGLYADSGRDAEAGSLVRKAVSIYEKLLAEDPGKPEYRANLANARMDLVKRVRGRDELESEESYLQNAVATFEQLTTEYPDNVDYRVGLARACNNLAVILGNGGRNEESAQYFREFVALSENLAAEFPSLPDYRNSLGLGYANLATRLRVLGQNEEATVNGRRGVRVLEELVADMPDNYEYRERLARSHTCLSQCLQAENEHQEAVKPLRDAVATWDRLATEFSSERVDYQNSLSNAHKELGILLVKLKNLDDANDSFCAARKIRENLVNQHSSDPTYRYESADFLNQVGVVIYNLLRDQKAAEYFRDCARTSESLVQEFPAEPKYKSLLALALKNLGISRGSLDRLEEKEERLSEVLEIQRRVLGPEHNDTLLNLFALSWLHQRQGRYEDAEKLIHERLEVQRRILDPADAAIPVSMAYLSSVYQSQARYEKAESTARHAKELLEKIAADTDQHRTEYAESLWFLTWALVTGPNASVEAQEAVALATEALEYMPGDGEYENLLGIAYYRTGNWTAALDLLNRSTGPSSSDLAAAFFFTAMAHWQLGDKEEARKSFDQGVDWIAENTPNAKELRRIQTEAATLLQLSDDSAHEPDLPVNKTPLPRS